MPSAATFARPIFETATAPAGIAAERAPVPLRLARRRAVAMKP